MLETCDADDPIVGEVLCDLYKPDEILTQSVEQITENEFQVVFNFPTYQRTIERLGHVSMAQMQEALLEGLFCSIGLALKNRTLQSDIDYETFLKKRLDVIFLRQNLRYKQMLNANEDAILTFRVSPIEEKTFRKSFYTITVYIDGFLEGDVEGALLKE